MSAAAHGPPASDVLREARDAGSPRVEVAKACLVTGVIGTMGWIALILYGLYLLAV